MPLGTEVGGLEAGDIVLHGDPAPLYGKGHSSQKQWSTLKIMQNIATRNMLFNLV